MKNIDEDLSNRSGIDNLDNSRRPLNPEELDAEKINDFDSKWIKDRKDKKRAPQSIH